MSSQLMQFLSQMEAKNLPSPRVSDKGSSRGLTMKRRFNLIWGILLCCLVIAIGARKGLAVGYLKFEQEFGGKGSSNGRFSNKIHLTFSYDGEIYVSDTTHKCIYLLTTGGEYKSQISNTTLDGSVILTNPNDIAVDREKNIYVADTALHHIAETDNPKIYRYAPCVHKFTPDGTFLVTYYITNVDSKSYKLAPSPVSLMVDNEGKSAFAIKLSGFNRELRIDVDRLGQLYVLDPYKGKSSIPSAFIHKFSIDGEKILSFASYGQDNGELDKEASDLVLDNEGNVLIADTNNHRVVKFDPDGNFLLNMGGGRRGRGNGEFTKPLTLAVLADGTVLVKDASQFKRHLGGIPAGGALTLVSPAGVGLADLLSDPLHPERDLLGRNTIFPDLPLNDIAGSDLLDRRLRLLEESEYLRLYETTMLADEAENKAEAAEDLKAAAVRATIYHRIIGRVQKFDSYGNYKGRTIYQVNKQSEKHHDLSFLDLDSMGHLYMRDGSELTIRKYAIEGFTIKPSQMNAVYKTNVNTYDNEYIEDYEDLDLRPDLKHNSSQFRSGANLFWNYDLSERTNFMLADAATYSEQDSLYYIPTRAEDANDFNSHSWDNNLVTNLKFITNPNPYNYKELNLYAERKDGYTYKLDKGAYPELNRQKNEDDGVVRSISMGGNWDIFKNVNLWVQYSDFNPAWNSHNMTRRYYDASGDPYMVFASKNKSRTWTSELTIKF